MIQRGFRRLPSLRSTPLLAAAPVGLMLAGLMLSGCSTWDSLWSSDDSKKKLPGERIAVLQAESRAAPDPTLAATAVVVPPAVANPAWPQAGGYPDHAMGYLALSSGLEKIWSSSIGSGSGRQRLVSPPVVAGGRIFALDAKSRVTALTESDGREQWQTDLTPEDTRGSSFGGGVAVGEGFVFAATGYAEVIALNPTDGTIAWRKRIPAPARGAPTVAKGRVIAQTIDNQTVALAARTGDIEWTNSGILETAGLVGSVSPAADATTVVAPYSSGEVTAIRVENGRPLWQDNLASVRRAGALSSLADIRGLPVIDRGLVLVVSHSGRTVAIDQRTGARVWETEVGGVNTPWPAGNFVFVLTNDNELVALQRETGRIRWSKPLERYEDPGDKSSTPVVWAGPVLAGDRLWLAGSNKRLLALSPADGSVVSTVELSERGYLAPVVANGTLYVLTDGGSLAAYR